MTPTVSVALCTYNGARYLREQLLSILGQSVPATEIVLSDDGSTDDTVAIARRTLADARSSGQEPAVRLTVIENAAPLGVARNFEQALGECTGDFIALCDQDDIWHPGRLERLVQEFAGRPEVLLVHSDAALVAEDGSALGLTLFDALEVTPSEKAEIHSGHGFDTLLRRNLVTGATTMVRAELVRRATPFPESWIHDEWMAMIAAASARFDLVDEPLTDYRQHGGNQIGARKLNVRDKIRKLREPRLERNTQLVARASALVSALEALGDTVPSEVLEKSRHKLEHEGVRFNLPTHRMQRIVPILREGRGGKYLRYSRGRIDMLRDLLQPA
ncbi:MAG: glycosyltransferase family 2 protein [Lacisediminihabitans sp.]